MGISSRNEFWDTPLGIAICIGVFVGTIFTVIVCTIAYIPWQTIGPVIGQFFRDYPILIGPAFGFGFFLVAFVAIYFSSRSGPYEF